MNLDDFGPGVISFSLIRRSVHLLIEEAPNKKAHFHGEFSEIDSYRWVEQLRKDLKIARLPSTEHEKHARSYSALPRRISWRPDQPVQVRSINRDEIPEADLGPVAGDRGKNSWSPRLFPASGWEEMLTKAITKAPKVGASNSPTVYDTNSEKSSQPLASLLASLYNDLGVRSRRGRVLVNGIRYPI